MSFDSKIRKILFSSLASVMLMIAGSSSGVMPTASASARRPASGNA